MLHATNDSKTRVETMTAEEMRNHARRANWRGSRTDGRDPKDFAARHVRTDTHDREWLGEHSVDEIIAAHDWAAGRQYAERYRTTLDSIAAPQAKRRTRVRSEHEGELVMDRALAGDAECFDDMRARTVNQSGRILRVTISYGANSDKEQSRLVWGGCAAAAFVDAIEDAGYRCEIDAVIYNQNLFEPPLNGQTSLLLTTPIKKASEPLDIDFLLLVAACPAFYRVCTFASWISLGRCNSGLGYIPQTGVPPHFWGDIHFGEAYSPEAASGQLRKALETIRQREERQAELAAGGAGA